jgi:hypothetical protein
MINKSIMIVIKMIYIYIYIYIYTLGFPKTGIPKNGWFINVYNVTYQSKIG